MKPEACKIICYGEILWDNLPAGPKPGGAPMNVAYHLHRHGLQVEMVSRVGTDIKGNGLMVYLNSLELSDQFIQQDPVQPTSEVLVHLKGGGKVEYEICEPVAWDFISLNAELRKLVAESGIIVFGSLASRNVSTRNTLLSLLHSDIYKVLDINLRPPFDRQELILPLMEHADMLKLNDHELHTVAGWLGMEETDEASMMKTLASMYHFEILCMTRGENGAVLYADNQLIEHPGYRIEAFDPVGAGDAFLAGFIAARSNGGDYSACLDYACKLGAFIASSEGANPDYQVTLPLF
jgi:fructokinase